MIYVAERIKEHCKRSLIRSYLKIKRVDYSGLPQINGHIMIISEKMNNDTLCFPRIRLGRGIYINSGYDKNLIGKGWITALRTIDDGKITIKDNVKMSNVTIVSMKEVVIEDDVMIGGGVCIWDTDFHSLDFRTRVYSPYKDIVSAKIVVKQGAFIGAGAMILKGVTIGKESIIAAGSVISNDVPDHEIWGGNPARSIRKIR